MWWPALISGMFKAPASRPVAGTFYDLVTAYVSFVRLRIHHIKTDSHRISFDVPAARAACLNTPLNIYLRIVTSNYIARNISHIINFKNQRVSTRNYGFHIVAAFSCAAQIAQPSSNP